MENKPQETHHVRALGKKDWPSLADLLNANPYVHRHMGWIPPLDWLGKQPYYGLFEDGRLIAALACPLESPEGSWIQLFVVSRDYDQEASWDLLWGRALAWLRESGQARCLNVIPTESWFEHLLGRKGFQEAYRVLLLTWESHHSISPMRGQEDRIRRMKRRDLEAVQEVDQQAFEPIWRNSGQKLARAYEMAALATVVEEDGEIIAYQISTASDAGGHLARLAVLPEYQGLGVGTLLVKDLLLHFEEEGFVRVSVNTQSNNPGSLNLYRKLGFREEANNYPIFQYKIE